jgi:hypothetical protein
MKKLFYTLVINIPDRFEPNQEIPFPYVPAIEGKTILGISTYYFGAGGANNTINGDLLLTPTNASCIFVNFSNAENKLIIQDYPYNAFVNTDDTNLGTATRAIKQPFAFVFSSKFSYVVNKSTFVLQNSGYALQFRFTYLDK